MYSIISSILQTKHHSSRSSTKTRTTNASLRNGNGNNKNNTDERSKLMVQIYKEGVPL